MEVDIQAVVGTSILVNRTTQESSLRPPFSQDYRIAGTRDCEERPVGSTVPTQQVHHNGVSDVGILWEMHLNFNPDISHANMIG